MINTLKNNLYNCMKKSISALKKNFSTIRTNIASPSLLNNIYVDYYGSRTPISQLSSITIEDSRTLKITIFDVSMQKKIEKSILNSNLGLNPFSKGLLIYVPLPSMTEERRKELIKLIRVDAENTRISIRNIRRDLKIKLKKLLKNKEITQDIDREIQNEIQKTTDHFIKLIDFIVKSKEKDILMK